MPVECRGSRAVSTPRDSSHRDLQSLHFLFKEEMIGDRLYLPKMAAPVRILHPCSWDVILTVLCRELVSLPLKLDRPCHYPVNECQERDAGDS